MVGHNPQGNIGLMVFLVFLSGQGAYPVEKGFVGVDGEQGVHILNDDGKTLKTHARVDVFLL